MFQSLKRSSDPETDSNHSSKRLCKFNSTWLSKYTWLNKVHGDDKKALCTLCNKSFTITHGGESDVKKHAQGVQHAKCQRDTNQNSVMSSFLTTQNSKSFDDITAAEVSQVYHAVQHEQSYRSLDCMIKLNSQIFKDCEIGKKMSCGRTKAEAIVTEVLAPASAEDTLRDLESISYFSVASDASNHGNTKVSL
ncbi:hypothetical protein SNE40_001223 [Patella caerulea]|uniref:BED-type domain-containing protein n=1 Tax=Patella caerulea TaxID=87958 RepID=A0AAN8KN70_PATCE